MLIEGRDGDLDHITASTVDLIIFCDPKLLFFLKFILMFPIVLTIKFMFIRI